MQVDEAAGIKDLLGLGREAEDRHAVNLLKISFGCRLGAEPERAAKGY